jgi:predicted DNA-binding transcriptional regulator AlpA
MSAGLLDWPALKARGVVGSRPTLHRYLTRARDENPFPKPLRDTRSGRRYWQASDVESWQGREAERKASAISVEALVLDDEPARWAPGRGRRANADLLSPGTTQPRGT